MEELEVKILEIDREKIEKKLVSLGARKVFDGGIHALYYDFPDGSIGRRKDVLRLRKVGNEAFLTYKRYIKNKRIKARDEFESEVEDFDEAREIIESLGLRVWLENKKRRTSYNLKDAHFELDKYLGEYDHIPLFLEIEAKNKQTLYKYVKELGYKKQECRPWTIVEVADYYSKKT